MERRDMMRKIFFGLLLTQILCLAYADDSTIRPAETTEFPFQVSIRDLIRDNFLCSGVLITNRTVLAPASCISPDILVKVSAGSNYRSKQNRTSNCERQIIHSGYNRSEMTNDIALITVVDPFKFDEFVAPARIPLQSPGLVNETTLSGWNLIVPDESLKVYENYTVWRECRKRYNLEKDLGPDEFCGDYRREAGNGSLISHDGVVYGLQTDSSNLRKMQSFVEISFHVDWIRGKLGKEALEVKWHGTERNEAGSPSNCLAAMLIFAIFLCQ